MREMGAAPNEKGTKGTPKRVRKWRRKFLSALCHSPNVSRAAKLAGRSRSQVYRSRELSPHFARAWDDALEQSIDAAEGEAYRRAVTGVLKPVFGSLGNKQGSGQIGQVREHSDTLLIFLLKAHKPQKYRDRIEHSGDPERPLEIEVRAVDYRNGIAALAPGSVPDRGASGEAEDAGDGPALG